MRLTLALAALLLASQPALGEEEPPPSALLFGKKCGGCHTQGEGDRQGPDLLGVTRRRDRAWIEAFIRNPGAKIDAGDPIANELFGKFKGLRMPEQVLDSEQMSGLLAYLAACDEKGGCKLALGKVKHANEATPADIERGRALFEGRTRLASRGPACLSCHHVRDAGIVGGGTLAKDLTFVYARLGDTGLTAALDALPFPLMKDVYAKRPLRSDEAFALKAYFARAARDGSAPGKDHNFAYLGVIGLLAALGTIGAVWSKRLGGVRQAVVKRGAR